MADMKLFSWGANSYGQLANGNTEDVASPSVVQDLSFTPEFITGGGGHTLLVTDTGQLYTCGSNNKSQLGLCDVKCDVSQLQQVEFFTEKKVTSVAGGWDHTVVCTDQGELYTWGSNHFGQLGCLSVKTFTNIPTKVTIPENVVSVAAGLRHSMVLTVSGKIYAWGSGKKGQLGICKDGRSPAVVSQPEEVFLPKGAAAVKKIACGAYHSAAITEDGSLYVWGDNKHGQMTLPTDQEKCVLTPCKVTAVDQPVSNICSGWTHLLALEDDGQVLSWGRNDYGQLGRPTRGENGQSGRSDPNPKPVVGLHNPTRLACGSEHNLAVINGGCMLSWGWNEHGICGTADEVNVLTPQVITTLKHFDIHVIGCGNGHSFAYGYRR